MLQSTTQKEREMKKIVLYTLLLSAFGTFAFADKYAVILQELTNINKRLDTMQRNIDKRFEQVDKRFEQIDKRFEQADKHLDNVQHQIDRRFDFLQNILYLLIMLTFTSPFVAIYLRDRKDEKFIQEQRALEKTCDALKMVLIQQAQDDKEMAKLLKSTGLMAN